MLITSLKNAFFTALFFAATGCCISMPMWQQTQNLIPQPPIDCSLLNSIQDNFLTLGEWPNEKWWQLFNSEELNCLIETALLQNYTIFQFFASLEIAKQEARIARSKLFPLIYFKAEDTWEYLSKNGLYRALNPDIPLNGNLIDLSLSFSYEFDFWGKNHNLFQSALGEASARAIEIYQTKLLVSTSIAQVYFALKTNLVRKKLYTKYYEVKKNIYELQERNRKEALISKLPLLISEENVLEAHQLLVGIDDEIERNKHLLNQLLGRGPDSCLDINEELPRLPENVAIPCDLSIALLARRPDLMAQIWRVKALSHQVGAAMADYYPNINLSGLIGLESTSFAKLFQSDSKTAMLKPALTLPIFTAGSINANVRAKKAVFDEAVYNYDELILKSVQEVADLLSIAKSTYLQLKDQEIILNNEQEIYQLVSLRRVHGLSSLFSSYDTDANLIEEELEYVTLLYNQYLSIIKLIKALGGGFNVDCIPLEAGCCP